MVQRTPLKLPPGIVRRGSEAEIGAGRWYEGNLVRWIGGVLRPVGGWERVAYTTGSATFNSTIRKLHTWILLRIKEAGRRPVRADHLVPRLDEALRRLRLTRSSEMARGLAQASEHASRRRRT